MDKTTPWTKYIIIGVVVILVVGGIIAIIHHNSTTANNTGSTSSSTDNTAAASATAPGIALSATGENSVVVKPTTSSVPIIPGPAITIHLLTPIANNVWKIGGENPIAWDNAANITGEIDLVDATSKDFVGVILSNTGTNQTSYIWDARSIYLGRYSADKKDVVPGTYSIRIHFDGNGLGDLISGPITITN